MTTPNLSSFIWSVADLLRGDFKQSEYGKVILPFTVLRRLDCVLEGSKAAVLAEHALRTKAGLKMRKSLGSKRKELSPAHIEDLTRLFGDFEEVTLDGVPISRIFRDEDFGYRTITVERPERDAQGRVVVAAKGKGKGKPAADSALRDTENVPLREEVEAYFRREVLPHAPDAWIDHDKTKVGYEIPFNRHFYVFKPPRPLSEIDAELKGVTDRIVALIGGLTR